MADDPDFRNPRYSFSSRQQNDGSFERPDRGWIQPTVAAGGRRDDRSLSPRTGWPSPQWRRHYSRSPRGRQSSPSPPPPNCRRDSPSSGKLSHYSGNGRGRRPHRESRIFDESPSPPQTSYWNDHERRRSPTDCFNPIFADKRRRRRPSPASPPIRCPVPAAGSSHQEPGNFPNPHRPNRWDLRENPNRSAEAPPLAPLASVTSLLNPFDIHEGSVKEYIDEHSGILEIKADSQMSCFFHADSVRISNRHGNPYGPPISIVDPSARPLAQELPLGSAVKLRAVNATRSQQLLDALALMVWPKTTENPLPEKDANGYMELEKQQVVHFEEFTGQKVDVNRLVEASLNWPDPNNQAVANVCELKNAEFGIIEVEDLNKGQKLYALFHRNNVWLRDGKRGVEVDFFRDKPLSFMMNQGQKVNLSARSILNSKGKDMSPVALEFQAVAVSLDPDTIPTSCPQPTRCSFGPGVYGSRSSTSYFYLEPSLFERLNQEFSDFINVTGLHLLPEIDPACKVIKIKPPFRLTDNPIVYDLRGKIVKIFNGNFGLVKLNDGKGFALANISVGLLIKNEPFANAFPVGCCIGINTKLVDGSQPIAHMATLMWNPKLFSREQVEGKDVSVDHPDFKVAYERSNCEFPTFSQELQTPFALSPPASTLTSLPAPVQQQQQRYENASGRVFKILDANFALIEPQDDPKQLALFDTCDIWMTTSKTAEKYGKKLEQVMRVGQAVRFHATFQGMPEVPYLATSVWCEEGEILRSGSGFPATISNDKIHADKLAIYRTVVESITPTLRMEQSAKDYASDAPRRTPPPMAGPSKSASSSLLRPFLDCSSASIKCLLDDQLHGILADDEKPNCLCWFSLDDLNLTTRSNVKDVVMVLNRMKGIKVQFQARLVNEHGAVQYVAHEQGVQLVGRLPSFMTHLGPLKRVEKSRHATTLKSKRMDQFWQSVYDYNQSHFRSVSAILGGGGGGEETVKKTTSRLGVVKHILNDSFGVLYDGKEYGLFDTYDVYLDKSATAAEAGKFIKDVLSIGDQVHFNAIVVGDDNDKHNDGMSFLCTGLWTDKELEIPPLSLDKIQEEKLAVYKQVSASCASLIKKLKEEDKAVAKEPVEKPNFASGVRREQVERFYSSPPYKEYARLVPKHRRRPGDPQTPDRNQQVSASEFTQQIKQWQDELLDRYHGSSGTRPKPKRSSPDLYEHFVTGIFRNEINSRFAIFKLSNGQRALMERSRIWAHDKQFRGGWMSLPSRAVNIRARAVSSRSQFQYQVIFCHFGYHSMESDRRKFSYHGRIREWIEDLDVEELLNAELKAVEQHGY